MDRQAQLTRLVWLYTTDIKARKLYAWAEALTLDKPHLYPGISDELRRFMTGLGGSLESENRIQQKPLSVGRKLGTL